MANKIKILFLAADPRDTQRLRLGEEARAISEAIRRGEERDALEFASEWAVRTGDVQAALQRHQPQIVHFSGHADRTGGIYLEDQDGLARAVGRHALKGLFSSSGKSVRVVVLNACASLSAVDAFRGVVDYCIGMNRPITDDGARVFAEAFYGALSSGSGVAEAYEAGKVRLQIEGFEVKIPVLRVRRGAGRWPIEPPPDPDAPDRADEMQYLRTLVSRLD
ncbi:MAG TPA: CHAT domain-containing protein, partial [Longimicrobium sp.]